MAEAAKKEAKLVSKTDLLNIDPDLLKIVEDPKHPAYDERIFLPLPEWLITSVDEDGVINPIKIKLEGDDYIVIDGRQRVRAAREANKRRRSRGEVLLRVPCHPMRADEKTQTRMMVKLNEHRQEDDSLTRAKKMARLQGHGYTNAEIATHFAKTESFVEQHLALLDCVPEIQKAVLAGNMSVTAAIQFAQKPVEAQVAGLKALLGEDEFENSQTVDLSAFDRPQYVAGENAPTPEEVKPKREAKKKVSVKEAMKAAKEASGEKVTATANAPSGKQIKAAILRAEDLSCRKNVDHEMLAAIRYTLEWIKTGDVENAPDEVADLLRKVTGQDGD